MKKIKVKNEIPTSNKETMNDKELREEWKEFVLKTCEHHSPKECERDKVADWWLVRLHAALQKERTRLMEMLPRELTLEDKRPISDYVPDVKMIYGYNTCLREVREKLFGKMI